MIYLGLIILLFLASVLVLYCQKLYKQEKNQREEIEKNFDILNKQQTFFIRKMIHEMKTPLSAIELHLSIMMKTADNYKNAAMIKSSARMLATIYDDIAFHAAKEKICYPAEWIDLEDFIADRIIYFDVMASVKNIFLDFETDGSFLIYMSKVELQRVIDNTLSNAIKYSTKSSSSIYIIVSYEKEKLQLSFRDEGIGMTPEEIQNIFQEYYRVSNNIQGLGLGMNIIKEICDTYGISIDIQSVRKGGSTFTYTFPEKIVIKKTVQRDMP